jgi:repressor LexA
MPPKDRQERALAHIRDHLAEHGRTPSIRELAALMGYRSPRSAAVLIGQLIATGRLKKRRDGRVQLTGDTQRAGTPTVRVPVLGTAPCGVPFFAEENLEGYVRVDTRLASGTSSYFVLRAAGDSMDRAGIDDGDLVLVRSCPDADDGDRVVALVDGEVTIKVLKRGREAVALEPRSSNRDHRPIFAVTQIEVQGVVVATLGQLGPF